MIIEKEDIIERKKIWLNRYRRAKFEAESLWRQAEEWQTTIYLPSCKVLDGMPGSPGFSNTSDISVIRYLDLISDAEKASNRAKVIRDEIVAAIETVGNLDYVKILTLRYIEGLDWKSITDLIHYSRQHTTRLHQQALDKIEISQKDLELKNMCQNVSK